MPHFRRKVSGKRGASQGNVWFRILICMTLMLLFLSGCGSAQYVPGQEESDEGATTEAVMTPDKKAAVKEEEALEFLDQVFDWYNGQDAESLAQNLRERAEAYRPEGAGIAAHLQAMYAEAEALRRSVPDFDLAREMEDADFVRMTAPHSGISLADAYFARHRAELQRDTARKSLEAVSRSLQSAGARPRELRETGQGGRFTLDPRSMSREEREVLKKRILEAKAQGRKLGVGE